MPRWPGVAGTKVARGRWHLADNAMRINGQELAVKMPRSAPDLSDRHLQPYRVADGVLGKKIVHRRVAGQER